MNRHNAASCTLGRLLQIANIHPTAGNLATYDYGYDVNNSNGQNTMLGQRSSMNATVPSQGFNNHQTKYYYDGNYQLTKTDYPNVAPFNAEIDSWTYDPIGNRLTNTVNGSTQNYSYYKNGTNPNNGQRVQSDGTNTYTYDNNGNTITKTGGYAFGWDYDNWMTSLSGPSLTGTNEYDYIGRRGKKVINGVTSTYLYDGQDLIREVGTTTAEYLFGPGIDEPLAMSVGGVVYYYNADGLGSINVLNDSPGTVQDKYVMDAWGGVKSQTIPIANPFTYTARETGEAGLMYYRARYYNPSVGRFISEDPVRFRKGPEFYIYVNNFPVLSKDPSGEMTVDDKSCNCYLGRGGRGGPPMAGGGPTLGGLIKKEGEQACLQKVTDITDPSLRSCVYVACLTAKITCADCDRDDPQLEAYAPGGYSDPQSRAVFCRNNWRNSPDGYAKGELGRTVIHEMAHTCGWHDCGGWGVPDNHKCVSVPMRNP